MNTNPLALEGRYVRLEPLKATHADALWQAGSDPEIWRFNINCIRSPADMQAYIDSALRDQERGTALPFVTVIASTGEIAGTTRFLSVAPEHRRVEIGSTFVAPRWQRTPVNTEAKYLMLRHAFEAWQCHRVEFKTSSRNLRSRAAILRLGATEEGTLRGHMIQQDGFIRDTVYFSVLAPEWPDVRSALEGKLASSGAAT